MKHNKRTIDSAFAVKATRVAIAGALAVTTIAGALAIDSQKAHAALPPVDFKAEAKGSIGDFAALRLQGSSALSQLNFLEIPGLSQSTQSALVDVEFGGAQSTVDSTANPAATAQASSLRGNVLGIVDLEDFSISAASDSNTNNGQTVEDSLFGVDVSPLVAFEGPNVSALSNWNGTDVCSAVDTPLSKATSSLGEITIGDTTAIGASLPFNFDLGRIFHLSALNVDTETRLVAAEGENDSRAIQAEAGVRPIEIELTKWLKLNILGTPTVTATASGQPGGASVEFVRNSLMTLTVTNPVDSTEQTYPVLETPTGINLGGLPSNGFLDVEFSIGDTQEEVAEDGTSASGSMSLLHLKISLGGNSSPIALDLIDTNILPVSASAEMAEGGLQCAEDTASDTPAGDTLAETGDNVALYQTLAIAMLGAGAALTIGTVVRKKLAGRKF